MFLESLLETSTQSKTRRGWATLTSFLIETAVIGLLILLPLLYTEALPNLGWGGLSVISVPPGPSQPPAPEQPTATTQSPIKSEFDETGVLHLNPNPPPKPYIPEGPETPPSIGSAYGACPSPCIPGSTGPSSGAGTRVFENILPPTVVGPKTPSGPVVLQSRITEGMLIRKVQPIYPPLAIQTRTQGTVVLRALIGRDGVIHGVEALSGHPLLIPAAVDAVRQWRYRPYILNGEPVEVETSVTVNFILNH